MPAQHGILHPSFFYLCKSDISLPKVLIILDTRKSLSLQTLIACLHPYCSRGGAGTDKPGWKTSLLQPSSLQGHWKSPCRARSTRLKQEGRFLWSSLLIESTRRGAAGATGTVQAKNLPLCPCCCHPLAQGRFSCCCLCTS